MGSSRVGSNPTRSVIFNNFDNVDKIDRVHCVTTSFPCTGRHCAAMAEWLRRLTRNQMGSSRVGSNPTRSVGLAKILERLQYRRKWSALSGNRTPVSRVAGENSTTEPTMLESCECPHSEIGPLPEKGQRYTKLTTMGIEPTIFRFEVGRLIHWATRPMPM